MAFDTSLPRGLLEPPRSGAGDRRRGHRPMSGLRRAIPWAGRSWPRSTRSSPLSRAPRMPRMPPHMTPRGRHGLGSHTDQALVRYATLGDVSAVRR